VTLEVDRRRRKSSVLRSHELWFTNRTPRCCGDDPLLVSNVPNALKLQQSVDATAPPHDRKSEVGYRPSFAAMEFVVLLTIDREHSIEGSWFDLESSKECQEMIKNGHGKRF
jgi:hypothetical protein